MAHPKTIVRRGYDLVSGVYRADDAEEGAYAEWLDLLEARVPPPAKMLDLGCGCGVPVARQLTPRYDVTGVDFSPGAAVGVAFTLVAFPEPSPCKRVGSAPSAMRWRSLADGVFLYFGEERPANLNLSPDR